MIFEMKKFPGTAKKMIRRSQTVHCHNLSDHFDLISPPKLKTSISELKHGQKIRTFWGSRSKGHTRKVPFAYICNYDGIKNMEFAGSAKMKGLAFTGF